MPPRLRKAIGVLALLTYIVLYVALIAVISDRFVSGAPWWAQAPFYLVAGIVWMAPLKPLFVWMNGAR